MSADIFNNFIPHDEIACDVESFDAKVHKSYYAHNYVALFSDVANGDLNDKVAVRYLCQHDLFFIVHFIMGIKKANHPFVVERCRMVSEGRQSGTVDVWAREHFKSVVLTIANTVKRILNDPECCTAIFSYKKGAADKFLDAIRKVLESPVLIWAFPEILYDNPSSQSPSWSLQGGVRVKRVSASRKEHTVEAYGLIEGMPTGVHADHRIYDDVETDDLAQNPDQLERLFTAFEMSRNLGTDGGTEQIIGTYYSHHGLLVKLGEKLDIHGRNIYELRIIPATDDGTINGNPVLFSQEYLDSKKTDSTFNSQQLCNPSPVHSVKLKYEHFKIIPRAQLPDRRVKFIIVDPAGDKDVLAGTKSDNWAMLCVSIGMGKGDLGLSDVYIEDGIVGQFALNTAIGAVCDLYRRSGRVSLLAVERVGQSSHYEHIRKALEDDFGVYLSLKKQGKYGGNLLLLSPSGRNKNYRIESALSFPLANGRLHLVDDLDFLGKLRDECDKFPFFHTDILDALSYLYDILLDSSTPLLPCGVSTMENKVKAVRPPSAMCA